MTSAHAAPAARAVGLRKTYGAGDAAVHALDGIDLDVAAGRFTAIMGPSGSGKSTLMHCLAGLDTPTGGTVTIGDADLSRMDDRQLTLLRRERIGFVFQQFNLLPTLTAEENIRLPLDIAGRTVVFADEPTGNLDSRAGAEVLGFLQHSVRELGQTVVMVTHDPSAAAYADTVVFLADGRLVDRMEDPTTERVLDRMKRFGDA